MTTGAVRLAGVPVAPFTLEQATAWIVDSARSHQARTVHLCTAHTISLCYQDEQYATLLRTGDANLADGTPVALIARRKNSGLVPATRPRGTDLMRSVLSASEGTSISHYFLGATPETLRGMLDFCSTSYPAARVSGYHAPAFRPITPEGVQEELALVEEAGASIVWVGLGTPKQDQFLALAKHQLDATFIAVGAAFDFLGASKREAPTALRNSGLEWLYRWATEPRRLARRYTVDMAKFFGHVAGERLSLRRRQGVSAVQ